MECKEIEDKFKNIVTLAELGLSQKQILCLNTVDLEVNPLLLVKWHMNYFNTFVEKLKERIRLGAKHPAGPLPLYPFTVTQSVTVDDLSASIL